LGVAQVKRAGGGVAQQGHEVWQGCNSCAWPPRLAPLAHPKRCEAGSATDKVYGARTIKRKSCKSYSGSRSVSRWTPTPSATGWATGERWQQRQNDEQAAALSADTRPQEPRKAFGKAETPARPQSMPGGTVEQT